MADYLMDIEAHIKDGGIKIGPDEDALTVGTPISGNASRDNCINVTIPASKEFLTPVKSVEKQVTPTADTSTMVQKVITTRRKVYISPRTTKSQQDPTIVQQEKVIRSGTRKKINLSQPTTISGQMPSQSSNLNNCPIAILSDQQGQTIHGVPLQDDCYRVSVDEVVKGAAFLPYEAGGTKSNGQWGRGTT
ncbi:hypothetical protein POM88_015240 [Heracleum sosnowskyi]|uniref:Uncharacterized protein n=1 Tax=Heracleum sosnowskyi TaxID=360622 RepID=A0AAD8MW45_9APIA|nr:hypothetical protein POM88_015240 [Heracleum sosnowskyi]